jgi:hypothetical protein
LSSSPLSFRTAVNAACALDGPFADTPEVTAA